MPRNPTLQSRKLFTRAAKDLAGLLVDLQIAMPLVDDPRLERAMARIGDAQGDLINLVAAGDELPLFAGRSEDTIEVEIPTTEAVRRCRGCGCTEDDCRRCVEKTGEGCVWVEDDLCSAYVRDEVPEAVYQRILEADTEKEWRALYRSAKFPEASAATPADPVAIPPRPEPFAEQRSWPRWDVTSWGDWLARLHAPDRDRAESFAVSILNEVLRVDPAGPDHDDEAAAAGEPVGHGRDRLILASVAPDATLAIPTDVRPVAPAAGPEPAAPAKKVRAKKDPAWDLMDDDDSAWLARVWAEAPEDALNAGERYNPRLVDLVAAKASKAFDRTTAEAGGERTVDVDGRPVRIATALPRMTAEEARAADARLEDFLEGLDEAQAASGPTDPAVAFLDDSLDDLGAGTDPVPAAEDAPAGLTTWQEYRMAGGYSPDMEPREDDRRPKMVVRSLLGTELYWVQCKTVKEAERRLAERHGMVSWPEGCVQYATDWMIDRSAPHVVFYELDPAGAAAQREKAARLAAEGPPLIELSDAELEERIAAAKARGEAAERARGIREDLKVEADQFEAVEHEYHVSVDDHDGTDFWSYDMVTAPSLAQAMAKARELADDDPEMKGSAIRLEPADEVCDGVRVPMAECVPCGKRWPKAEGVGCPACVHGPARDPALKLFDVRFSKNISGHKYGGAYWVDHIGQVEAADEAAALVAARVKYADGTVSLLGNPRPIEWEHVFVRLAEDQRPVIGSASVESSDADPMTVDPFGFVPPPGMVDRDIYASNLETGIFLARRRAEADKLNHWGAMDILGRLPRGWCFLEQEASAENDQQIPRPMLFTGFGPDRRHLAWVRPGVALAHELPGRNVVGDGWEFLGIVADPPALKSPRKPPTRTFRATYHASPDAESVDLGLVRGFSKSDVINQLPAMFADQVVEVAGVVTPIDPGKIKLAPEPIKGKRKEASVG